MEQEFWKPIIEYEGLYDISNLGNIKSLFRSNRIKKDRIMKPTVHCTGYRIIGLVKNGKQTLFRVHRLVALHFCEKKDGCDVVNHKNGIKHDNVAENLEWTTISGNTAHSFKLGLQKVRKGNESNLSVLTEEQVIEIRNIFNERIYTQKEIGRMYNVSRTCVHHIVTRKNWSHI